MRKIYNYQLVRYYLNDRADEFINIGLILKSNDIKKMLLLKDKHRSKIDNCSFIQKKHLIRFMDSLEKNGENRWYQNYLKFSKEKIYESEKNFDEVLQWLYDTKIGYKFEQQNKKINELTKTISDQNIKIQQLEIFSYHVLEILKKNMENRYAKY